MATPNPQPAWLDTDEYDYYVKQLATDPISAQKFWDNEGGVEFYELDNISLL